MGNLDYNRLLAVGALLVIIVIAAVSNYRLEVGAQGLKFEPISSTAQNRALPS